jgi:hypothetical protein
VSEGIRISAEVLDFVDDYVAAHGGEEEHSDERVGADAFLLNFCRSQFEQLFANVIGEPITGFNLSNAAKANVLRRRNRRVWSQPLRRLTGDFQRCCKMYPDLVGAGYSDDSEAMTEFHLDFIPKILLHLWEWAEAEDETALAQAAAETRDAYDLFLTDREQADG